MDSSSMEKVKEDVEILMAKLSPEEKKDLEKLLMDQSALLKEMGVDMPEEMVGENFLCSILPFLCGRRREGYRQGYSAETEQLIERLAREVEWERQAYAVDDAMEAVKEDMDMLMEKLSPEDQKDLTKLIKDEAEMIKEMGDSG